MAKLIMRFFLAAVVALTGYAVFPSALAQKSPQGIAVTAKRFEFGPNEIRVKKGEPVVLEITALDFPHGFNLPDFKVRADLIPGKVVRVSFTPDKAGRFTFFCDNFCGEGHEDMSGTLIVEE